MAVERAVSMGIYQAQTYPNKVEQNPEKKNRVEKNIEKDTEDKTESAESMPYAFSKVTKKDKEKDKDSQEKDKEEDKSIEDTIKNLLDDQKHLHEKIQKSIDNYSKRMGNFEAKFGVHEATNRVMIKLVDKDTKEVIKEIPPEKTLDMIAKCLEQAGVLVDEKI